MIPGTVEFLDVCSKMYPELSWIKDVFLSDANEKRPLIICEYSHAMGQRARRSIRLLETDLRKRPYSRRFHMGMGGSRRHFSSRLTEKNTMHMARATWGITRTAAIIARTVWFTPTGGPHTGLLEMKSVYAPAQIDIKDIVNGEFYLKNLFSFSDFSGSVLGWNIEVDGMQAMEGTVEEICLKPQETAVFKLPYSINEIPAGRRFLNIWLETKQGSAWADAGLSLFQWQAELPGEIKNADNIQRVLRDIHISETYSNIHIEGQDFHYTYDKIRGSFSQFKLQQQASSGRYAKAYGMAGAY